MKQKAKKNAQAAFLSEQSRTKKFDNSASTALSNPLDSNLEEQPQPTIFQGNLKGYQLKGMTWLANLYDQVCNILEYYICLTFSNLLISITYKSNKINIYYRSPYCST